MTYAIIGTALPAGLSVSSAGSLTGTPTVLTADATYTLRGTDEYGRTTDDTFTLEVVETSTFDPVDLFASGEQGGLYLPGPTTCFTDTAGTTAAGVGDAVARIDDSSGNGNHATQATAADRPILRQEATGEWYLEFDGAADVMETVNIDMTGTDKATVVMGIHTKDTSGGNNIAVYYADDTSNYRFVAGAPNSGTNHYRWFATGTSDVTVDATAAEFDPPSENVFFGSVDFGGDETVLRLDGTQIGTGTGLGTAGNLRNEPIFIGRLGADAALFAEINLFGLTVIDRLLTTAERDDIEAYKADRTSGVTL